MLGPLWVWLRARIGRFGTGISQTVSVLAGLAAIIPLILSFWSPSNRLVADIYPMEFRQPINLGVVTLAVRNNQPMNPEIAHLLMTNGANGFARIQLYNGGSLPIDDVRIRVSGASLYVSGTPNMGDSSFIPSDSAGAIKLPLLEQGSSITIYAWAGIVWGTYTDWSTLNDQFQITFSKGVADKRFHIPVGTIAEWIDRNLALVSISFSLLFLLPFIGLIVRLSRYRHSRQPEPPG